jgi:HEAT repeat protein
VNDGMLPLMAYDWGGDRGALAGIDQRIAEAQGDKKQLKEIEKDFLEVLQSDAKLPAKEYVCRQLAFIGTGRSVPVLAKMLYDEDLSDGARFALEGIPGSSVDKALRAALEKLDGDRRVGIVNSLGERGDRKAIPALSKMQNGPDKELSAAVETSLRKIAAHTEHGPAGHGRGDR